MAEVRKFKTPSNMPDEFEFQGCIYHSEVSQTVLESLADCPVPPDDIFVAGYPKSENNWVVTIVSAILSADKLDTFEADGMKGFYDGPFEYIDLKKYLESVVHPSVFFTHLLPLRLPRHFFEKKHKIIHLMRNPNDVAVSYFHFHRMYKPFGHYKGRWEEFFPHFLEGGIVYSSWYDHTREWVNNTHHLNVKHVNYEDVLADPYREIMEIATFLGRPLTDEQLEKIVSKTKFDEMKKYTYLNKNDCPDLNLQISPFMRKGKVGDWKNYFNEDQKQQAEDKYQELVKQTGVKVNLILRQYG